MAGIVPIAVGAIVQSQLPRLAPAVCCIPFRSFSGRPAAALVRRGAVRWCRRSAQRDGDAGPRGIHLRSVRDVTASVGQLAGARSSTCMASPTIARARSESSTVSPGADSTSVAYDSRAHGESSGAACTYGFYEKQDLRRVVDTIDSGPVVLMGTSLGAAVALQEAAEDARVSAVVAAETFSDLRTVAIERAPFFFTPNVIRRAFQLAEAEGRFTIEAVSPETAARKIEAPVLIIHGSIDRDTAARSLEAGVRSVAWSQAVDPGAGRWAQPVAERCGLAGHRNLDRSDAQRRCRIPMKLRWALVVMGMWIMGSICMSVVATENFYTIDRLLDTSPNVEFHRACSNLGMRRRATC
jgi:hypothetical protein